MREIQRQTSTFAYRLAEKSFDYTLVDRLEGEFNDWAKKNNITNPSDLSWAPRGPIGHWPNIELFLKNRYPAAHRNLAMGDELSRPLMDRGETPKYRNEKDQHPPRANPAEESLNVPYETGPEALAKYGYDPKEITAAMLLLHDDSHIGRTLLKRDQNRLNDIARKRHKMQEAFEMAHHAIRLAYKEIQSAFNQELIDRLSKEFDDWWYSPSMDDSGLTGGMMYWPNIENFLKQQYPAAHRNLQMGREQAGNLLDDKPIHRSIWLPNPQPADPYETGPEAISQYGYDPKEIAAGMLWLHNRSHGPKRDKLIDWDANRLNDIAQKRYRMQHAANIFR